MLKYQIFVDNEPLVLSEWRGDWWLMNESSAIIDLEEHDRAMKPFLFDTEQETKDFIRIVLVEHQWGCGCGDEEMPVVSFYVTDAYKEKDFRITSMDVET